MKLLMMIFATFILWECFKVEMALREAKTFQEQSHSRTLRSESRQKNGGEVEEKPGVK